MIKNIKLKIFVFFSGMRGWFLEVTFNNKDDSKRKFIQFQKHSIVEQVVVNTENFRKACIQEIDIEVGDLVYWPHGMPNYQIKE